ncbi:hypothetical protein V6N13_128738 [Hibiscus sabdariffa]
MGSLGALMKHPDDFYPLLKLKMAARHAEQQIPSEPHWGFCFSMLHKVSRSFALVIQQLDTQLRNAVCIFYLVLRALDTVEDDTSVAADVKVPILIDFYRHIYNPDWHFSYGLAKMTSHDHYQMISFDSPPQAQKVQHLVARDTTGPPYYGLSYSQLLF